MNAIGVGIIGGSTTGWASLSHIPALAELEGFDLRAVSTSRRASADVAAARYQVTAHDNAGDLIHDPAVDLVVVSVKVTEHLALVTQAIESGKIVYSEWPLGNGLQEAEQLAALADRAGIRTVIGLQGRYAPEVRLARDLIRDGYVGDVLGTTVVGSGMVWGPRVPTRTQAYWYDDANGASPLTSATLHALDAVQHVLGDFESLASRLLVGRKHATIAEDGAIVPVTVADQVALHGTLTSGAAASVFYRGGTSRGENFRWEINGTDGDLAFTADWGNMQVAQLTLSGGQGDDTALTPIAVPTEYTTDVPQSLAGSPAANVARLYRHLERDLSQDTNTAPDFRYGLSRHRLIAAIERSSATDTTQRV